MDNYSNNDITEMQDDAVKQILEMQKRAIKNNNKNKKNVLQAYENILNTNTNDCYDETKNNKKNNSKKEKNYDYDYYTKLDVTSRDNIDKLASDMEADRMFLLILIIMLRDKGCDDELILALLYIIM